MKFDSLPDPHVLDVFVPRAVEGIGNGLSLGIQKILLRHDLNNDLGHFSPSVGWCRTSFGMDKAEQLARIGLILAVFLTLVFRLSWAGTYPQALILGPETVLDSL